MAERNPMQRLANAFNNASGAEDEGPEAQLVALLRSLGLRSADESKVMAAIEKCFANGGGADPVDYPAPSSGASDAVHMMQQIRLAEAEVMPFVGAVLGQDSAAAVYGEAIRRLGGKTFGASPSAYRAIFDRMRGRRSESQLAQDAIVADSFAARFPAAAAVRRV